MLNFGASKPRVGGGAGPPAPPLDPRLHVDENGSEQMFHDNYSGSKYIRCLIRTTIFENEFNSGHCFETI